MRSDFPASMRSLARMMDLDIEMLVFAAGRERTEAQWRSLLEHSGFELTRATPHPGIGGLVEAAVA